MISATSRAADSFICLPAVVGLLAVAQRQGVQRTGGGAEMAVGKVQVDRGLFQIVVTEEHLDGAQVGTRFEQMSGKAMPPMSLKT